MDNIDADYLLDTPKLENPKIQEFSSKFFYCMKKIIEVLKSKKGLSDQQFTQEEIMSLMSEFEILKQYEQNGLTQMFKDNPQDYEKFSEYTQKLGNDIQILSEGLKV